MFRGATLSEDMQRELKGENLKEEVLTESTVTVNRKLARYILGVMDLATNWSQFETRNKRLMSRLSLKQENIDSVLGKLGAIAKTAEKEGEEEGTDE
jgi:hypothetical protein